MSYDTQLPHSPAPVALRNGLGTTALILGIIGTLSGFIPLFFWLAGVLGLIALILGLAGRGRVKRGEANNKGVALTGTILGLAALVLSVVGAVITFTAVSGAVDELEKIDKGLKDSAPKNPGGKGGKGGTVKALAAGDSSVYDDKLQVTVSAAKPYTPSEFAVGHTKGNKAYQVTVTLENGGTKAFDSVLTTLTARAGEKGTEAEQIADGDTIGGFNGTVLPGKKATATFAFDAPADAKTLTVEVSPGLDHDASQWELKIG
ncbi:DUF4352 domain-containing protein [Streptomyces sp. NPDC053493]|uniref:DUF4352 domain-containing protein n=1 Tax=Streptomyces sp. NPDC053493 TaxID=3365705 RepID=UPI0037D8AE73